MFSPGHSRQIRETLQRLFKVKPNTAKTYVSVFENVMRGTEGQTDPTSVSQYLTRTLAVPNQRSSKANAVRKVLSALGKHDEAKALQPLTEKLWKENKEEAFENPRNQSTPSESEFSCKMRELEGMRDRTIQQDQTLLFLYLLEDLPPLRTGDYTTTTLDGTGDNTLDMLTGRWVIKQFKTSDKKAPRVLQVSKRTLEHIYEMREVHRGIGPFLFVVPTTPERPMSASSFSKFTRRELGATPNDLRRRFVSSEIVDGNASAEKRRESAKAMGHSVATQQKTYSRDSLSLHGTLEDIIRRAKDKSGEEVVRKILLALV